MPDTSREPPRKAGLVRQGLRRRCPLGERQRADRPDSPLERSHVGHDLFHGRSVGFIHVGRVALDQFEDGRPAFRQSLDLRLDRLADRLRRGLADVPVGKRIADGAI